MPWTRQELDLLIDALRQEGIKVTEEIIAETGAPNPFRQRIHRALAAPEPSVPSVVQPEPTVTSWSYQSLCFYFLAFLLFLVLGKLYTP